jgi:aspartate carbamoyltransferase regulatory subunit
MKELSISAIKNGTVIDHIPTEDVFRIVDILQLSKQKNVVSIATNLPSKKLGRKGIIKVSNISLDQTAIDAIALLAAGAKITIIKDFKVVSKQEIEMPDSVEGIVACVNPNCITNKERSDTKFTVLDKTDLKLQCYYCSKILSEQNLRFKKY